MIHPVVAGLAAPLAVLVASSLGWLAFDAAAGFVVLAVGAGGIIASNLAQLRRLARWAEGPDEAPVPEGSGGWEVAFNALHRRVRDRSDRQRGVARTLERFVSAAQAMPDGMVLLDGSDRVRWANARAQLHLGVENGRDVGTPIANLVRQPEFARYLECSDFTTPLTVGSQRSAGATLLLQIIPFGADERLLISRDVSTLEATARMRREFIANVSHELKTPLTVISGFVETMRDTDLEPQVQRRCLDRMAEQARSMARLIDDLLALSALESEDKVPEEAPFEVEPLLQSLCSDARALSNGRHEIALAVEAAATVHASRDEIASAFGNLVGNAVRYTPPGGRIGLAWRRGDDEGGEFSVVDTGPGIAAEHLPRLTERFYRVDRSRSRETGGTGLGLAIVKHVLIRHQATLAIESAPGQGSTFTVRLPAARVAWRPGPAQAT